MDPQKSKNHSSHKKDNENIVKQEEIIQENEESIMIDENMNNQILEIDHINDVQQVSNDYIANQLFKLNEKTQKLHADEQLLKQQLKLRQQEALQTFSELMNKKKILLQLIKKRINNKAMLIDISLNEQLNQLHKIVKRQNHEIIHLKTQIAKQGLAGVLNDESLLKLRIKAQDIQKQIQVGRKFSSTQYVRDYLQRPQAYKVNYQQAKYQYQTRVRLKQSLQQQRAIYQIKKQQLLQMKKKQRQLQQQLLKQLDYLQK